MKCPKCQSPTEKVAFNTIEVDRCMHCFGIWFDMLEKDRLLVMKDSERIDCGDPVTGERMNHIEDIKCPVCGADMIRMVDAHQHHIWFESCSICYGVWLDAGEFRDLKDHSFLDLVRGWMARERR